MFPDDESGGDAAGDESGPPDPAAGIREPDPEASLPDPAEELPTVPDPTKSMAEVPDELLKAFWSTVLVFNLALLALAVGTLMVAFDVRRPLGVGVLGVGVLAFVRGYLKYRAHDGRGWDG